MSRSNQAYDMIRMIESMIVSGFDVTLSKSKSSKDKRFTCNTHRIGPAPWNRGDHAECLYDAISNAYEACVKEEGGI